MDLGAMVPSGWYYTGWYSGFGFTLGFRYLHRSGFTLGFKLPMFGMTFGNAITSAPSFGPQSVSIFYLASLISLPIISLGYRF